MLKVRRSSFSQNYLQHADHFSRRLAELNLRNNSNSTNQNQSTIDKSKDISTEPEIQNKNEEK